MEFLPSESDEVIKKELEEQKDLICESDYNKTVALKIRKIDENKIRFEILITNITVTKITIAKENVENINQWLNEYLKK